MVAFIMTLIRWDRQKLLTIRMRYRFRHSYGGIGAAPTCHVQKVFIG